MKKYLFFISTLVLVLVNRSFSQFAAGYTNTANVLTFSLKPTVTTTTNFSVIEFFVRYPNNSPAFTYGVPVPNTVDFPGMTATGLTGSGSWEVEHDNPAYAFPGYHVDHILYTAPAPVTGTYTYNANQVYNAVSFQLIGNPANSVNFDLVHQSSETSFYYALTNSNGADLRPASPDNYFFPTTSQENGPGGSIIYFSSLTVPLPVKILGFNVTKTSDNALLTWQIENETDMTDRYEIERSLNGIDFVKFATVLPKNNGASTNSYELKDLNLTAIRSSGVIYYRVKQIDKDGKSVTTPIKNLRLDSKMVAVSVYPNPVKDYANITLDLLKDQDVVLTINDAAGKQVQNISWTLFKGLNVKKINLSSLASGNYMLKVGTGSEIKTIPIVKTR